MEYGSIERELLVDASPEVVFDVISSPEHMREWWNGVASDVEAAPGSQGEFVWGDRATGDAHVVQVTVMDSVPPRLFSFRWVHEPGEVATVGNSLLVTFELTPSGSGTVVRMTETGWRELGWEAARLEEAYNDHVVGWDTHLGGLRGYLTRLVSAP